MKLETSASGPDGHSAIYGNFHGAAGVLRSRQIRLVSGCALGLATGFAGLFFGSLTIFLKPIAQDFGWTRAQTSAAIIMSMLGLAVGCPLQGWFIDRFGARGVIAGSVLAFAAALAALAYIPNNHLLFAIGCFAIGVTGAGTSPNGYLSLLPRWFDARLGTALAVAMVGVGVGASLFAPLAQWLVLHESWRGAFLVIAGIALAGGLTAVKVVGVGQPPLAIRLDGEAQSGPGLDFGAALRDWRFVLLALALGLGGASGLGMTFHTAPMLDDRGFAPAKIAVTVALGGLGVMLGRFAGGTLMDFVSARVVGAATYLLGALAAAILGLDLTRSFPVIAAGGLILGMALGTEGDFAAFAVRRYFGMRAFAGLYGAVFASFSLGSVAGVIACGRAFDAYGNYRLASVACVASFLVAAVLVTALGPYRYPGVAAGHDEFTVTRKKVA